MGLTPMTFIAVDLLANRAGAEIGAHRGGARTGDDDGGHHGTDLGNRCQRCTGTGQVACADLDQHDVQREDDERRVRNREHECGNDRHPGDEPDLIQQLPPGERPAKHRTEGLTHEDDEVPDGESRLGPGGPRHGRPPGGCGIGSTSFAERHTRVMTRAASLPRCASSPLRIPHAFPSSPGLGRTVRERWLAVNATRCANEDVN